MRITTSTVIERPAAEVWDILGRRFGEAAAWASSIDSSRAVGEATIAGAPSRARECRVAVPGADRLVEELIVYDDTAMTFTYRLAEGMEQVARSAHNTWTVTAREPGGCELRIDAEVELSPPGRILAYALRPYLAAMGRRNADDLKVYAETGSPSPRKQRQASGAGRLASLVAANAAFTALAGGALTVGSGWWARQLGGVTEPVVSVLGISLIGYAVLLGWTAARGVSARTGQTLALLDAAWVIGTATVLVIAANDFTPAGTSAAVGSAGVVAAFGWSQWRAIVS